MSRNFSELMQTANLLVRKEDYQRAVVLYREAIDLTNVVEIKIDIYNTLGRLYQLINQPGESVRVFIKSISLHDTLTDERKELLKANKATVFNNLGVILTKTNPGDAVKYHKKALQIFKETRGFNNQDYSHHLANTYYSLGSAAYANGDLYQAKKSYNRAIEWFNKLLPSESIQAFIVNSYYHLGNIYTDMDNVFDARINYLKALKMLNQLMETNPNSYRYMKAITYNNLAVTAKSMYKYADAISYYKHALSEFELLISKDENTFLPYYAATLNSIAIIYSEQHEVKDDYDSGGLSSFSGFGILSPENSSDSIEKKRQLERKRKENAENYYSKALDIYTRLSKVEPDKYEHYVATCYHNLGVLFDSSSDFKKAEEFFAKAVEIRRRLAYAQPKHFNLDVCATLLNLVTMYQYLLEQTINIGFKQEALLMLSEITQRLAVYKDDNRSIVEGMRGDVKYFIDYFNAIDEDQLDVFDAIVKEMAVVEKIDETTVPIDKLKMQKYVVELYENLAKRIKSNTKLNERLVSAYTKYAWLALRSNKPSLAIQAINQGLAINQSSLNLKTNNAHYFLLAGDKKKAIGVYKEIKNSKNEQNLPYYTVIRDDLSILVKDHVLTNKTREAVLKEID